MSGRVITFYSYKGGVGRTLSLANVAVLLAQWGHRVLCIDWDLEAPGLHAYFRKLRPESEESGPGLVEMIQAYAEGQPIDYRDYLGEIPVPETKGRLDLMPAGTLDESYVRRLQALRWEDLHRERDLGNFLEQMRDEWIADYDFVLVDSRTGITDIGGICTIQLPDQLVLLFTANRQSVDGAVDVARRAAEARGKLPFDRSKLLVLPVPTRFEDRSEYAASREWLDTFARVLAPLFSEWASEGVAPHALLQLTRTPYVAFWSFGERLPVLEEGTRDPGSLGYALETLAAIVAHNFSASGRLVKNRDSYVDAARRRVTIDPDEPPEVLRGETAPIGPAQIFIGAAHEDGGHRDTLRRHLAVLERSGLVELWDASSILPGDDITAFISSKLRETSIFVALVSPDFLASKWTELEMDAARRAGARIVPVLLRPVDYRDSSIGGLQALPRSGVPVTAQRSADAAWSEVAQALRQLVVSSRDTTGVRR